MRSLSAIGLVIALLLTGCTDKGTQEPVPDDGRVVVDVAYLDHPPVQPVISEVDKVLKPYDAKVRVVRHDLESKSGQSFAEENGLTGHVAFAIFIDGKIEASVSGRTVRFENFPAGQAPIPGAAGQWTMEDLDAAIKQRVS